VGAKREGRGNARGGARSGANPAFVVHLLGLVDWKDRGLPTDGAMLVFQRLTRVALETDRTLVVTTDYACKAAVPFFALAWPLEESAPDDAVVEWVGPWGRNTGPRGVWLAPRLAGDTLGGTRPRILQTRLGVTKGISEDARIPIPRGESARPANPRRSLRIVREWRVIYSAGPPRSRRSRGTSGGKLAPGERWNGVGRPPSAWRPA